MLTMWTKRILVPFAALWSALAAHHSDLEPPARSLLSSSRRIERPFCRRSDQYPVQRLHRLPKAGHPSAQCCPPSGFSHRLRTNLRGQSLRGLVNAVMSSVMSRPLRTVSLEAPAWSAHHEEREGTTASLTMKVWGISSLQAKQPSVLLGPSTIALLHSGVKNTRSITTRSIGISVTSPAHPALSATPHHLDLRLAPRDNPTSQQTAVH